MERLLLPVVATALVALLAACGGGETVAPASTPEPTGAASPPATPTPAALPTPEIVPQGEPLTRDGIYVVDTASGRIWRAADLGSWLWSPDGTTLTITGCCIGQRGIDLIDLEAGSAVRIYEGDVNSAAWSPDGQRIAFTRSANGPGSLYVINRDGGGLMELADAGGWSIPWSADGDSLAYQRDGVVYLLDLDDGPPATVATAAIDFAWSPRENALAYTTEDGLYLYDPAARGSRQIASGPSGGGIVWSPDGSRIAWPFGPRIPLARGAFAGDPSVGSQSFYLVTADGSSAPDPLPPSRSPSFSPDSAAIAYLSDGCVGEQEAWDIHLRRLSDGTTTPLTHTPAAIKEGPIWSPDGSAIAYVTFDRLALVDPVSGEERTLAAGGEPQPGFHLHGDAWSADGRYLVLTAGGGHGVCD